MKANRVMNGVTIWTRGLAAFFVMGVTMAAPPRWQVKGEPVVVEQTVHFENAGANLEGTLYAPAHGGHLPAIVVLHSAGASTRDYALYRHLSHDLPALGFAVLVFDRRGSGASTGTLNGTDYEQLADDGIAGLHAIANNSRIDPHRIGFWGLSQGGWLSILAASRTHDAAFAVSVSAPMVTAARQMEFAVDNLLALRGYGAAAIDQATDTRNRWQAYLRGTNSRDDAIKALAAAEHQPWFDNTFMSTAEDLDPDPRTSSWRKEMDLDPMQAVKGAHVPLLFIYGGADPWVPVEESARSLQSLMQKRHDIEVHVIAGINHAMAINPHETMSFDKASLLSEHPESPAYFFILGNWLSRHAQAH